MSRVAQSILGSGVAARPSPARMIIPVHPCLCGFLCKGYAEMKRHREKCAQWQNRSNAFGITLARRKQTREKHHAEPLLVSICIECRGRLDHHEMWCSLNQEESVRRAALARHAIDPEDFEIFLKVLSEKYRR